MKTTRHKGLVSEQQVSVHKNGRPRARRSGPWSIRCVGHGHGVHIELSVSQEQVLGRTVFELSLPTEGHCEAMANWLKEAAKFLRA